MIVGIGIDVVSLERFSESLTRPGFSERVFSARELESAPQETRPARMAEYLAGHFAAKEALAKALGAPGGLAWVDCEVAKDDSGQPALLLSGAVKELAESRQVGAVHLSITHDAGVAAAVVVLEK
jgi:holo-[acyl-carrier protein] synthase